MRKQARRLWAGDWQRDREEPAGADDVVILPPEEGDAEPRAEHRRNVWRAVASAAVLAALCAVVLLASSGGGDKRPSSAPAQAPPAQVPPAQTPQGAPPAGFGGPDLTSAAAAKAAEAALAKYPGNVERVTQGPSGDGYIVHVFQSDGNEVHVVVSGGFKVLGSDAAHEPPGFGESVPPSGTTPQGGSGNSS